MSDEHPLMVIKEPSMGWSRQKKLAVRIISEKLKEVRDAL